MPPPTVTVSGIQSSKIPPGWVQCLFTPHTWPNIADPIDWASLATQAAPKSIFLRKQVSRVRREIKKREEYFKSFPFPFPEDETSTVDSDYILAKMDMQAAWVRLEFYEQDLAYATKAIMVDSGEMTEDQRAPEMRSRPLPVYARPIDPALLSRCAQAGGSFVPCYVTGKLRKEQVLWEAKEAEARRLKMFMRSGNLNRMRMKPVPPAGHVQTTRYTVPVTSADASVGHTLAAGGLYNAVSGTGNNNLKVPHFNQFGANSQLLPSPVPQQSLNMGNIYPSGNLQPVANSFGNAPFQPPGFTVSTPKKRKRGHSPPPAELATTVKRLQTGAHQPVFTTPNWNGPSPRSSTVKLNQLEHAASGGYFSPSLYAVDSIPPLSPCSTFSWAGFLNQCSETALAASPTVVDNELLSLDHVPAAASGYAVARTESRTSQSSCASSATEVSHKRQILTDKQLMPPPPRPAARQQSFISGSNSHLRGTLQTPPPRKPRAQGHGPSGWGGSGTGSTGSWNANVMRRQIAFPHLAQ